MVLVLLATVPATARAYINAGFRSEAEARQYYRAQREERRRQQLAVLNEGIFRDPKDAVAYYQRGRFYADVQLNDWKNALEDFDAAIRLKPDFAKAYVRRAAVHFNLKDDAKCAADLEQAVKLDPEERSRLRLATIYLVSSNPEVRNLKKARALADGLDVKSMTDDKAELLAAICADELDFESAIKWESQRYTHLTLTHPARQPLSDYKRGEASADVRRHLVSSLRYCSDK
jgi:tetratricopeptide (TPR) repeat protein